MTDEYVHITYVCTCMYCICLYARIKFIIYDAGMDMFIYLYTQLHSCTCIWSMVYRIQDLFLTLLGITERSVTYHALHISHRLRTSEKQNDTGKQLIRLRRTSTRHTGALVGTTGVFAASTFACSRLPWTLGLLPFPADFF